MSLPLLVMIATTVWVITLAMSIVRAGREDTPQWLVMALGLWLPLVVAVALFVRGWMLALGVAP